MARRLRHRGPDEQGGYLSADGRCAIGFQRLCVIDPAASHQPMTARGEAVTLAFNGEIYNFRELRDQLAADGVSFATRGDTEVLLAMYLRFGLNMLDRLEGMFAVAIHDGRNGELHLIRDRLGVKPLWYAVGADRAVFASEAKALLAHGGVDVSLRPQALAEYMLLGYVPAPASIWQGILKLPPGHCVSFGPAGAGTLRRWWRPPSTARAIEPAEAVEQVRRRLTAAVSKRLVADVPVGTLLSGGIDSSIIAALMCRATGDPGAVKTFCVGFSANEFDERPFARRVAEHLGTDHHELLIEPDAADVLDELVRQYDEPFADSSALATYWLCKAVREQVTVALCGDGGDEVFGGYDRHRAMWLSQRMSSLKALAIMAAGVLADSFAPRNEKSPLRRFARFAGALDAPPALRYLSYRRLFTIDQTDALWTDEFAEHLALTAPRDWFVDLYEGGECDSELLAAQRCDVLTYLPDDLLIKADIASMASGLELRSPMLDHEVVQLGLSLPDERKVNKRRGKRILAEAFGADLPAEVFRRPKAGFGVPIDSWLRTSLLDKLRETLLDQSFIDLGWFKRTALQRLIDDHIAGKADHRHRLWALLWLGRWQAMGERG